MKKEQFPSSSRKKRGKIFFSKKKPRYSLRPKINAILWFKICPTKNTTLTKQSQKTGVFRNFSQKKQSNVQIFLQKTKGNLVICTQHWFTCQILELHLFWNGGSTLELLLYHNIHVEGYNGQCKCERPRTLLHCTPQTTILEAVFRSVKQQ